jgi:hypothetical protein
LIFEVIRQPSEHLLGLITRMTGTILSPVTMLYSHPINLAQAVMLDPTHIEPEELSEENRTRKLPTEYNACSRSARNNFFGAIDGHPIVEYKLWNRDFSCCGAGSVMARS